MRSASRSSSIVAPRRLTPRHWRAAMALHATSPALQWLIGPRTEFDRRLKRRRRRAAPWPRLRLAHARDEKIVIVGVRRYGGASGHRPPLWDWIRPRSRFWVCSACCWPSGVLTARRHLQSRATSSPRYIWFAVLFTLSSASSTSLGSAWAVGQRLAGRVERTVGGIGRLGYSSSPTCSCTYVFVSQTAHLLAIFGVFLDVGVKLGVPPAPLAFQLLFATNYFAAIDAAGIEREPAVRRERVS